MNFLWIDHHFTCKSLQFSARVTYNGILDSMVYRCISSGITFSLDANRVLTQWEVHDFR